MYTEKKDFTESHEKIRVQKVCITAILRAPIFFSEEFVGIIRMNPRLFQVIFDPVKKFRRLPAWGGHAGQSGG